MLRNSASGPEICLPGRILAGLLPGKHRNRPSGRPKAGRTRPPRRLGDLWGGPLTVGGASAWRFGRFPCEVRRGAFSGSLGGHFGTLRAPKWPPRGARRASTANLARNSATPQAKWAPKEPTVAGHPKAPYKFIGFGAMDVTKPCKSIRSGPLDATKTYEFIVTFV
jgi:hypothetical protein